MDRTPANSQFLYYTDIMKAFESNARQALPSDNIIPAQCCHILTDEWFWKQEDKTKPFKSADQVRCDLAASRSSQAGQIYIRQFLYSLNSRTGRNEVIHQQTSLSASQSLPTHFGLRSDLTSLMTAIPAVSRQMNASVGLKLILHESIWAYGTQNACPFGWSTERLFPDPYWSSLFPCIVGERWIEVVEMPWDSSGETRVHYIIFHRRVPREGSVVK